jgi:hypothetical protein
VPAEGVSHRPLALVLSVFVVGAESLGSGRWVQGREAIACDAEGALDAAAGTGTLLRRGRRPSRGIAGHDEVRVTDHQCLRRDGAGAPGGAPRPEPGAGSAGRGAAGVALSTPGMGDRLGVKVPWRKRWC